MVSEARGAEKARIDSVMDDLLQVDQQEQPDGEHDDDQDGQPGEKPDALFVVRWGPFAGLICSAEHQSIMPAGGGGNKLNSIDSNGIAMPATAR